MKMAVKKGRTVIRSRYTGGAAACLRMDRTAELWAPICFASARPTGDTDLSMPSLCCAACRTASYDVSRPPVRRRDGKAVTRPVSADGVPSGTNGSVMANLLARKNER